MTTLANVHAMRDAVRELNEALGRATRALIAFETAQRSIQAATTRLDNAVERAAAVVQSVGEDVEPAVTETLQ